MVTKGSTCVWNFKGVLHFYYICIIIVFYQCSLFCVACILHREGRAPYYSCCTIILYVQHSCIIVPVHSIVFLLTRNCFAFVLLKCACLSMTSNHKYSYRKATYVQWFDSNILITSQERHILGVHKATLTILLWEKQLLFESVNTHTWIFLQ